MRCADAARRALLLAGLAALGGCGGGNSTETTLIVAGVPSAPVGVVAVADQPQGPNTTEIVVDGGPATGFAIGVANLPYVTVKLCAPGSATACVSIDHVFLDTGSIGLRVLRSAVVGLPLPAMRDGGGTLAECYPFVIGAVWGAMARADLSIGEERAADLPIQVIDDASPAQTAAPADCVAAANGELLNSVTRLQARGVLGVGMLRYDCGLLCERGDYSGGYTLYYRCDAAGDCRAAAVDGERQLQNPVTRFAQNNNGTVVVLPPLPELGASVARGRLVFGIGTQANNQPLANETVLNVQTDPAQPGYLYLAASMAGAAYPYAYVDSGSNGLFFDDPALSTACAGNGGGASWYCPTSAQQRRVELLDMSGRLAIVDLSITSADLLFAGANTAFANLGGAAGSANPGALVLGLPFFFGRRVSTAIWGQALAVNGPWYAF